jgi:hypothetical protein
MPRPSKNAFQVGLERVLNDKQSSPLANPGVFKQIAGSSGMPISQALKYIGKRSRQPPKPSDDEKSKARIEKLEAASEEK